MLIGRPVRSQPCLRGLRRTIANRYEITDVLYRLTDQVVEVLRVDGAGVSIADRDEQLQFVTATDDRVSRVEERQATHATARATTPTCATSG